jgi:conjugal transfer/entry exclusion protein
MQRRDLILRAGRLACWSAALAGGGLGCAPCWALFGFGDIVFDPANYVQTLTTAINAVKQTWAQYEQLRQQLQQLMQGALQLQSIDPAAAAAMLAKLPGTQQLQTLESATTATSDLIGSLQAVQGNFARRLDEARLGYRSWADYDRAWNDQLARRDQAAMARVAAEKAAEQQVSDDFQAARDLGARISGTVGTHEAQQLMNLQLNRLIQQHALLNQQLSKYLGGHEAEKLQSELEDAAQAKAESDDARQRHDARVAADQAALSAWANNVQGRTLDGSGGTR